MLLYDSLNLVVSGFKFGLLPAIAHLESWEFCTAAVGYVLNARCTIALSCQRQNFPIFITHACHLGFCPGLPGWAGTSKVKPFWIYWSKRVSGYGISWSICKSAPWPRNITMPASHQSVFYRPDALPAAQPTASLSHLIVLTCCWDTKISQQCCPLISTPGFMKNNSCFWHSDWHHDKLAKHQALWLIFYWMLHFFCW